MEKEDDRKYKYENDIENFYVHSRNVYENAIEKVNDSSDKLSQELTTISSFILGFIVIFFDSFLPNSVDQEIVLIVIVLVLLFSVVLGLTNKLVTYLFWKNDILPVKDSILQDWTGAKAKMQSGKDLNMKLIYYSTVTSSNEKLKRQKKQSPEWLAITQFVLLQLALFLIFLYGVLWVISHKYI